MIQPPRETPGYETIPLEEFDKLARQRSLWESGPEMERPVHNGPYQPHVEVRGVLKDGRKVRAIR